MFFFFSFFAFISSSFLKSDLSTLILFSSLLFQFGGTIGLNIWHLLILVLVGVGFFFEQVVFVLF